MVGMGKHVHGLDLHDMIILAHLRHIPGHRRRVTGDIDYPLRPQFHHFCQDVFVHPRSGRVYDKDIRLQLKGGKSLSNVSKNKVTIVDSVGLAVSLGINNGALRNFHTDNYPGLV